MRDGRTKYSEEVVTRPKFGEKDGVNIITITDESNDKSDLNFKKDHFLRFGPGECLNRL